MSELPLNSVEVWKIKNRGNGTLVCRYTLLRTDSSPVAPETLEMRFANNYRSTILADNLDFIMRNQQQFSRHPDRSIHGLVQIDLPSEEERKSAAMWSRGIRTDATEALAVEVLQGKAAEQHFWGNPFTVTPRQLKSVISFSACYQQPLHNLRMVTP